MERHVFSAPAGQVDPIGRTGDLGLTTFGIGYAWTTTLDLRRRAVAAYDGGEGILDVIAHRFGVGRASLNRWLRLRRETGGLQPRAMGGDHWQRFDEEKLSVLASIAGHPQSAASHLPTPPWRPRRFALECQCSITSRRYPSVVDRSPPKLRSSNTPLTGSTCSGTALVVFSFGWS